MRAAEAKEPAVVQAGADDPYCTEEKATVPGAGGGSFLYSTVSRSAPSVPHHPPPPPPPVRYRSRFSKSSTVLFHVAENFLSLSLCLLGYLCRPKETVLSMEADAQVQYIPPTPLFPAQITPLPLCSRVIGRRIQGREVAHEGGGLEECHSCCRVIHENHQTGQ